MSIENHYRHISIHNYDRDDKTMLQGSIDELTARGCAELLEEDELKALAEKCTERMYGEPGPWRPLYDGYTLEITSVRPEPDKSCMRPFIPGFDD